MSNIFSINDVEMDNTVSGYNRICSETDSTVSSIPSKFQSVTKTGLFSSGLSSITKQLSKVSSSASNIRGIIQRQSAKTYEMELNLAKEADRIEIPQDFVKNDAQRYSNIKDIVLNKKDGKSVNEGQETEMTNEIADSSINKENLVDIVKEDTKMAKEEFTSNVKNAQIGNINNGVQTEEQVMTDNYSSSEEQLVNINNETEFEVHDSFNENSISHSTLGNINNNTAQENVDYDDSYNMQEIKLESMNASACEIGNTIGQQESTFVSDKIFNNGIVNGIFDEKNPKNTIKKDEGEV